MERLLTICLFLLTLLVAPNTCWQYFTPLSSITLANSQPDKNKEAPLLQTCRKNARCENYEIDIQHKSGGTFDQGRPRLTYHDQIDRVLSEAMIHSEYYYGNCRDPTKKFYTHVHLDHMDVLGKVIVRGWIDVIRIPTCIILMARAFEYDIFRNTAYNFQMCVPRITYCHSQHRFKYHYYEWYIPLDMVGGMNWDLYFYGPASAFWQ